MQGCHQSLHPHSRPWHTLLGLPLGCQPRPRALLSTNPSPNWWALPKPVSPAQRLFWLVLGLGCALVCTTDECAQSVAASQGWEKGWMARVTWVSGGKKPSQVLLPLEVGRWGRQEKGRALWLLGALLCSALARRKRVLRFSASPCYRGKSSPPLFSRRIRQLAVLLSSSGAQSCNSHPS